MSCRRGPGGQGRHLTVSPGSVPRGAQDRHRRVPGRRRRTGTCRCSPTNSRPPGGSSPARPSASTVDRVTGVTVLGGDLGLQAQGAEAAGPGSRIAIHSVSSARPRENGGDRRCRAPSRVWARPWGRFRRLLMANQSSLAGAPTNHGSRESPGRADPGAGRFPGRADPGRAKPGGPSTGRAKPGQRDLGTCPAGGECQRDQPCWLHQSAGPGRPGPAPGLVPPVARLALPVALEGPLHVLRGTRRPVADRKVTVGDRAAVSSTSLSAGEVLVRIVASSVGSWQRIPVPVRLRQLGRHRASTSGARSRRKLVDRLPQRLDQVERAGSEPPTSPSSLVAERQPVDQPGPAHRPGRRSPDRPRAGRPRRGIQ